MRAVTLTMLGVLIAATFQGCSDDPSQEESDAATAADSTRNPASDASAIPSDDAGADASGDASSKADAGKSTMTFFVTSTGTGAAGGDFGGVVGADIKCQKLAKAVGGGDHTWAAYLGVQGSNNPHPKDRIGPGPWKNQKGTLIAQDVAALLAKNLKYVDILDETGKTVPAGERAIFTGAAANGKSFQNANCNSWTSTALYGWGGHADSDTNDATRPNDSWSSGINVGCSAATLAETNGSGRIYCFAKD